MENLLDNLRILASTVSRMDEGIRVFDAIAESAKELNRRKYGGFFGYVQNAAVADMVISFGRVFSKGKREISFYSTSKLILRENIVDPNVLKCYFNKRNILYSDDNFTELFREDFYTFADPGYEKLLRLRDKLVAHHEKGVKWEDVGASFIDARAFVEEAHQKIDTCYLAYLNVSAPRTPLSEIDRQRMNTDRQLRNVISILKSAAVDA